MIDTLIDEIIAREGVKDTNDPNDSGGRTKFGISEKYEPEAWKNGPPTIEVARQIYFQKYIVGPGFPQVKSEFLMAQLVDWGVTSGPQFAIQHLQKVLGLTADGKLGPQTLLTIAKRDPIQLNNQLVDDRVLMLARLVQKRPTDLEFLFGWQSRALSFRK